MARRQSRHPGVALPAPGQRDQERRPAHRARGPGRGLRERGPDRRRLRARHLHARDPEPPDPLHPQGLEVRLQLPVQGRGLLRRDAPVHRPEVGHAEPGHAARRGVRPGAAARLRHLRAAGGRRRQRCCARSSAPTRTSAPTRSPSSCARPSSARSAPALGNSNLPMLDLAANQQTIAATLAGTLTDQPRRLRHQHPALRHREHLAAARRSRRRSTSARRWASSATSTKYTKFQAAEAIGDAANNPGGAGEGMGMGMGMALGQQMASSLNQQAAPGSPGRRSARRSPARRGRSSSPSNGQQVGPVTRGRRCRPGSPPASSRRTTLVWRDGLPQWSAASELPELRGLFPATPPPLPPQACRGPRPDGSPMTDRAAAPPPPGLRAPLSSELVVPQLRRADRLRPRHHGAAVRLVRDRCWRSPVPTSRSRSTPTTSGTPATAASRWPTIGGQVVQCQSCGATTETTDLAGACQFCGGALVALDHPRGPRRRPRPSCRSTSTREGAKDAFGQWVGSRWFAPSALKKVGSTEALHGTYVPHWTFDAQTNTRLPTVSVATTTTSPVTDQVSDGKGGTRTVTRQERRTRWRHAVGSRVPLLRRRPRGRQHPARPQEARQDGAVGARPRRGRSSRSTSPATPPCATTSTPSEGAAEAREVMKRGHRRRLPPRHRR